MFSTYEELLWKDNLPSTQYDGDNLHCIDKKYIDNCIDWEQLKGGGAEIKYILGL